MSVTRPTLPAFDVALRRWRHAFLLLTGVAIGSCAQSLSPRQMYEGPPLPKEQLAIIHSGCTEGAGLTIMTTQIDGKNTVDSCADYALLPGEHLLELSAKQQSPRAEIPVTSSGMVFGRPTPMATRPEEGSRIVWVSTSPL
ncbi:MAG TPA: hypothetical protein VM842_05140, partial [Nitrospira sp.]|nr:hypothetical protein [Nitrospira sp.]